MKRYLPTLAIVLLLNSCMMLIKDIYGIKQPKAETPQSICKWLTKKNFHIATYTLDSNELSPSQHGGKIPIVTIPRLEIYNPQGYLIFIKNNECSYRLLDSIGSKKAYIEDTGRTFKKTMGTWDDIDGNRITGLTYSGSYKFVVYWAVYGGRVSTNLMETVNSYVNKHPNDILIFVNSDFLACWPWVGKYFGGK